MWTSYLVPGKVQFLTDYLRVLLAHREALLAILLVAVAAGAFTAWANFWLMMKSCDLARDKALSKSFLITTVELILMIVCLAVWVVIIPGLSEMLYFYVLVEIAWARLDAFSLVCLSFFVLSPLATMFLFPTKQQDVANVVGSRKKRRLAIGLAIESAAFYVAFFFILAGLVLPLVCVLFSSL